MSDKGLFSRWAARKQQVQQEQEALNKQASEHSLADSSEEASDAPAAQPTQDSSAADHNAPGMTTAAEPQLTDDDMPDVEAIDGNTNVSAFFSEGVSEKLRKQALKAMFLKPEFNIRDGMDDYDLDYTDAPELTADVVSGLRQWFNNKDPLESESTAGQNEEQEARALTGVDENVNAAESDTAEVPQNATAESATENTDDNIAKEKPEPDQNQTDLASDKATSADSASENPLP
ncbi:DUF3306 domain-containing protein [Oceanospirillum linum]|uniref:DUF3306 domain-containing protein n=1 Tax=Oceanospirillum linum TaxID=966 RepID=A0A1T1HD15_OCELI|nr:DUF3306 domain-containing protein [Oceanospirillum linum]OOV87703.1 hypothetical protein BTA35_0206705 [Oceanospirillum linum]SEG15122.1 Protein of unknown function [Oleiphilus messinensis]SMP11040.1 Protein of unknown function [Oceanospirillum linum]